MFENKHFVSVEISFQKLETLNKSQETGLFFWGGGD